MQGQEPETIASSLMHLLRKIISNTNGPYLIFAWTKHDELLKGSQQQLELRGADVPRPYFLIDMEKNECLSKDRVEYQKVSAKLDEELSRYPVFTFLTKWEKAVADSGSKVISLISTMIDEKDREKWMNKLGRILYQIAKAQSGKLVEEKKEPITRSAMKAFNSILRDCIERRANMTEAELLTFPKDDTISTEVKSEINARIHLRDKEGTEVGIAPGNLYLFEDFSSLKKSVENIPECVDDFHKDFFESISGVGNPKPCLLEITPVCDYNKGRWKVARLLVGLVITSNMINRIKSKAEFLYVSPSLSLSGVPCNIVFNFHYAVTLNFGKLAKMKPRYEVRFDLLSDIQNRFSYHMSRRGILSLK